MAFRSNSMKEWDAKRKLADVGIGTLGFVLVMMVVLSVVIVPAVVIVVALLVEWIVGRFVDISRVEFLLWFILVSASLRSYASTRRQKEIQKVIKESL